LLTGATVPAVLLAYVGIPKADAQPQCWVNAGYGVTCRSAGIWAGGFEFNQGEICNYHVDWPRFRLVNILQYSADRCVMWINTPNT
jgi:hypothetical protein